MLSRRQMSSVLTEGDEVSTSRLYVRPGRRSASVTSRAKHTSRGGRSALVEMRQESVMEMRQEFVMERSGCAQRRRAGRADHRDLPSVQLNEATTIVISDESVDGAAQPSSGFPRVGGSAATFDGTSGSHSVTFTIAAGNANPNTVCPKESCTTNIAATQCIVPGVVLTTNQGNALAPFALVVP
jgi:hypothetical protein